MQDVKPSGTVRRPRGLRRQKATFTPRLDGAKGKGDFSGTQELGSPGRHRHHHKPVAGAGSCDTMLLTERALRRREQFLLLLSSPPISSQWPNEPRQPGKCNL